MMMMNSTARCGAPFTAAQWQELEHQALIFKYLMAGVPVPQELLIPIRRSFEALPARYYHHPALGYCSYYGKKIDPEPGRCRRTDGKKWRCAKDAYPDSKYCERHMNRGRNRSRKPVESSTAAQTQSSSSTVTSLTSLTPPAGNGANSSVGGNFPSIPLHSVIGHGNYQSPSIGGSGNSHLLVNLGPFANRYSSGFKPDVNEHSFFSETSGSAKGLGVDSFGDSSCSLMPSRVSSFPLSKARDSSFLHNAYPELQSVPDLGQVAVSSYSRQPQHSFFGCEFTSPEPVKNESQPLHPFFDEWPNARDSWSDLEERSNHSSFSTTQLSISIPLASSDFSTTSSISANGDD